MDMLATQTASPRRARRQHRRPAAMARFVSVVGSEAREPSDAEMHAMPDLARSDDAGALAFSGLIYD